MRFGLKYLPVDSKASSDFFLVAFDINFINFDNSPMFSTITLLILKNFLEI